MRKIEVNIYKFAELSEEAKKKAIKKWYENEEYEFLTDDLMESLKSLLTEKGVQGYDLRLQYSLSYSQGDGLCFTGILEKGNIDLVLTHSARYYYANSVNMIFRTDGEETEEENELKDIYFDICKELEKEGYGIIEYRMNNEEFAEHCEANDYEYTEDGEIY